MKKKICFVDYDLSAQGGVEQVTVSLANALVDYYDVCIVSLCLKNDLTYVLDDRVQFFSFCAEEKKLRYMRSTLVKPLEKFLKENDVSVAIAQGTYVGFIMSALRLRSKTKLIFCDHGALMNQWNDKSTVAVRLISSILCQYVVTLTKRSLDDYQKKFHIPSSKIRCIYNWANLDCFLPSAYNQDTKKIISAGRFGKEKGFDQLIKAFALVAQKHPDWTLTIYGDGEMMPAVKDLVTEYHLESQVQLPGMCTDLEKRYQEYAMYVLPSYREGLPLVLLEAKANRLPIVSFDIMTGPREIVRDKVDGLLVPPKDISALADAMNYLIEHSEVRKEMSDHSQENLDLFSKEKILAEWKCLIDSLL